MSIDGYFCLTRVEFRIYFFGGCQVFSQEDFKAVWYLPVRVSDPDPGRIRIIGQDPDPYQETLIWIRVLKKNRDKLAYKSTKIIKI